MSYNFSVLCTWWVCLLRRAVWGETDKAHRNDLQCRCSPLSDWLHGLQTTWAVSLNSFRPPMGQIDRLLTLDISYNFKMNFLQLHHCMYNQHINHSLIDLCSPMLTHPHSSLLIRENPPLHWTFPHSVLRLKTENKTDFFFRDFFPKDTWVDVDPKCWWQWRVFASPDKLWENRRIWVNVCCCVNLNVLCDFLFSFLRKYNLKKQIFVGNKNTPHFPQEPAVIHSSLLLFQQDVYWSWREAFLHSSCTLSDDSLRSPNN